MRACDARCCQVLHCAAPALLAPEFAYSEFEVFDLTKVGRSTKQLIVMKRIGQGR
jgi:hypothetical protein